jgi:hypothetical protein
VNDTASIARQVVESGDTSNNDHSTSNAADFPDAAGQEFDSYMADDPTNATRRIAAAMMTVHDRRNLVSTRHGQVRRQHEDGAGITGTSETRRAAREALDGVSFFDGVKADPADVATMHANEFAADVNRQTMEPTLPTNASTADIVAAIMKRREAK